MLYKRGQVVETDGFDMRNQRYWERATVVRRSKERDCKRRGESDALADEFAAGKWYVLRMSDGSAGLWTHESRIRPIAA